jgi:hypothetical protein
VPKGNSLLLIALSGGHPKERTEIADRLVSSGKARLAAYSMETPSEKNAGRRVELLRAFLDGPADAACDPSPVDGLVIANCLSELEAAEIRRRGGFIWHLYSRPSGSVSIRRGDLIVTDGTAGFAHVCEPLEALSESCMAYLAANGSVRAVLEDLAHGPQ